MCFGFPTKPISELAGELAMLAFSPWATFQTTRLTGAVGYKYHRNVPIDPVGVSAGWPGWSREAAVDGCGPTAIVESKVCRCVDASME